MRRLSGQVAVVTGARRGIGPVDLLVNNAGINPSYGPLLFLDLGAAHKPLSGNADRITGQALLVDGGITTTRRGVT